MCLAEMGSAGLLTTPPETLVVRPGQVAGDVQGEARGEFRGDLLAGEQARCCGGDGGEGRGGGEERGNGKLHLG